MQLNRLRVQLQPSPCMYVFQNTRRLSRHVSQTCKWTLVLQAEYVVNNAEYVVNNAEYVLNIWCNIHNICALCNTTFPISTIRRSRASSLGLKSVDGLDVCLCLLEMRMCLAAIRTLTKLSGNVSPVSTNGSVRPGSFVRIPASKGEDPKHSK